MIFSGKSISTIGQFLFFGNRFITTPLRACANYMESWSRYRRVFVWFPSYRRPIIPRTNVPGLLMRKCNFPHCIRFNLIDIFSAWTSESMPKQAMDKETQVKLQVTSRSFHKHLWCRRRRTLTYFNDIVCPGEAREHGSLKHMSEMIFLE